MLFRVCSFAFNVLALSELFSLDHEMKAKIEAFLAERLRGKSKVSADVPSEEAMQVDHPTQ